MKTLDLAEQGRLPDWLIRWAIRRRLAERLALEAARPADWEDRLMGKLRASPVALATERANEQHYEVPAAFFRKILGPRLKYSATYWPEGCRDLDRSEEEALRLVAERAQLADGQEILELGCGWGSFTLWAAERYAKSRLMAVSNSQSQREYILAEAARRRLRNVEVRTADMNDFAAPGLYDRVVSIEMFEHMRNYEELLRRISTWLKPGGRLFVHIFTHCRYAYPFEDAEENRDWMARYFFTGGLMPSDDLLTRFDSHLRVESRWQIDGTHYSRTLEAWLRKLDAQREAILPILGDVYGLAESRRWLGRWRIFLMACSELFRFRNGREWMISHYRFCKAGEHTPPAK